MRRLTPGIKASRPRVSRRALVAGAVRAGMGLSLVAQGAARAADRAAGGAVFLLADLHSPYRRLPRLLGAIRAARAATPGPVAFVVNGDAFERGNLAALRSDGGPDWAFLAALAAIGPVALNIGNHETALADDLAAVVTRLEGLGVRPIGGPIDRRSDRPFAPEVARFDLGGLRVAVLGLPVDDPAVYRPEARALMRFRDPLARTLARIGPLSADSDRLIVASHAGVAVDRAILPGLPDGAFLFGGHDHLSLVAPETGPARCAHVGAWAEAFGVLRLSPGAPPAFARVPVADDSPADPALAALVAQAHAAHLTEEDRAVVATLPRPLSREAAAEAAAEGLRRAAGADAGLVNHTSFGADLPAGPVTRHDLAATLRFDDGIWVAEIEGAALAAILARANQHDGAPLSARSGDYLHAVAPRPEPGRRYRIAVNGWVAARAGDYLGPGAPHFVHVDGIRLRAATLAVLSG